MSRILLLLTLFPLLLLPQSRGVPGPKKTYTLSGTITGVPSTQTVEIRFTDNLNHSEATMQVQGGSAWSWDQATGALYTITPSHSYYSFTPKQRTIKVGGNTGNLNFQGSVR